MMMANQLKGYTQHMQRQTHTRSVTDNGRIGITLPRLCKPNWMMNYGGDKFLPDCILRRLDGRLRHSESEIWSHVGWPVILPPSITTVITTVGHSMASWLPMLTTNVYICTDLDKQLYTDKHKRTLVNCVSGGLTRVYCRRIGGLVSVYRHVDQYHLINQTV